MPAEFRYLTRQGRSTDPARLPSDTVEASYKRADLIRKLVVRDELQNRYLVFGSRAEFYEWYAKVPEAERACHEVIFGWRPQRFKFDVDAPAHKLDALSDSTLEAAIASATTAMGLETEPTVSATELDSFIDDILGGDEADPPSDQLDDDDPLYGLLDEEPAPIVAVLPTSAPTPVAGAANPEHVAKIRAIVNVLIDAILDELYTAYFAVEDLLPTRTDIAVTDSSGPTSTGWKYSFHIIVMPYFAPDHEEAREMSTRVIERLPESIRSFVDPNVYKKTQNFRMAGSAKPGTGRFKHLTAESAAAFRTACDVSEKDLLITAPVGARVLERVYTEGAAKAARGARVALTPQDPIVRAALDLANDHGVTQGHTFVEVRGTLLCFERSDPSHCRICNETHHKDNSLMISIDPAEGGHSGPWPGTGDVVCRIVEHCRQVRGKGRLIGEVKTTAEAMRGVASAVGGKSRAKDKGAPAASGGDIIAQRINGIREGRVNPHDALASEFERLPEAQKTIYAEDQMRDYELTPTLAVLAQMKLGKTKAMRRYVDEHFSADSIETKVVRFVTFRQTFSRALTEAFPDFVNYNDVQGDLDHVRHPRLIVQVESLHRIRMFANMEPVDLMILDEVESILAQFNSGLHKHFNAAFAMFQWMMRTARHVVCMDANLSDRTYRTLLRMRPAHPPHFHWNRFSRAADDVYHFTADHAAWLEKLYECARDNKKIVLPTNSLSEARAYEEALHREFPKKKIMLYSSETAPSEKALHFGDVHTYWKDLDVLIYTPTCSAGVSFELEHFDVLFGYFCDISCDVETCRQMLGRVRNLRQREHFICLRATGAALPSTIDEIRRLVYDKRAGLYRSVDDAALQYEYKPDGSLQYHESDYFYLWLETVRMNNVSRNEFARRFIDQVADTGASIDVLVAAGTGIGAVLLMNHREAREDLKVARCDAIAGATDLSPDEALGVRELLSSQKDVAPAMLLAFEKHQLREYYHWHGRPLDSEFVQLYHNRDARRVYRNLLRITEGSTVHESLKMMRAHEADHYSYAMETRTDASGYIAESRDLLREKTTYVFQAHFLAIWFLRISGFRCITDKLHVHEAALEAQLRAAIPMMKKALDKIVYEFEVPRPNLDRAARETDRGRFVSGMLRTINAVLRMMYGLQITRVAKRAGGGAYYLKHCKTGCIFIFSKEPEDDKIRGGPRPHITSNLDPLPDVDGDVALFIDDAFYARPESAPVEPDYEPAAATDEQATAIEAAAPPIDDWLAEYLPDEAEDAIDAPTYSMEVLDDFLEEQFAMVTARYTSRPQRR